MSTEHSDTRANDLPIVESTQIEKIAKTPLKRLRLTLANRFGLNSHNYSSNSPIQTPPPKRNPSTPTTLNKLDPQVYLDTQSNGFASRVVKYHEASEAKTRDIANKTYRRLGDFPIVNLDKSEINLNQKQANAPKVSKIIIAPPINLVSASARSTIFRTGKNYGDSYPIGPIGKIGPIEGRKPIRASISQDEPIVPSTSDYDGGSARSSLEALKEISRKRIHCDEIDGEVNKKQKGETTQDECDTNSAQASTASKRSRDRTSPSYCSSSNEVQTKRYRNNDILSSLSSSILMSTPKRSSLNIDAAPTKVIRLDREQEQTNDTHERSTADCTTVKQRSTESSRVGTSSSDLPLQRPMEQINKPVIKSMSDGHVPKPVTSKAPKLTLFNKDYSTIPVLNEQAKSIDDDDDDYSVSFVKPKARTSTLFSGSKNRDQKSKLQLMLSFLRGDESKDEVDGVQSSKIVADDKKSNEKPKDDESKTGVVSSSSSPSPSINLSTNTSVTFSTATTTSLLNVPTDAIKTITTELKVPAKETNEIPKEPEKVSTSSSSINPIPVTSAPATILSVSSAPHSDDKSSVPARTVTFNLSPVQKSTATSSSSQTTGTSSVSIPRLGGFCFSGTSTSFTLPTVAKPTTITPATENTSILQNSAENKNSIPTISFGLPQTTGSGNTLPSLGAPVFGSANALAKPATNTESSQSANQTSSALPTFNFGSPATKPTLATNTSVGFGTTLSASTTVSSASNLLAASTPSMFTFGTPANATNPVATPAFGSNVPTTSAPTFGFNSSATTATTALPTLNQSKPSFSFGNTANPSKPETSAFQFGNAASTKPSVLTFGSAATTTTATPLFGNVNTANANTTTTTQSAFTFTPNKPAIDTKPIQFGTPTTQTAGLGAFTSPTPPPAFGQTNSAQPSPAFGQTNSAQPSPAFGQTNSAQPSPAFGQTNSAQPSPAFGQTNSAQPPPPPYGQTPSFGSITNTQPTTTATGLFGNATATQSTSIFGQASNNTQSALPKIENTFGVPSNQSSSTALFGNNSQQTAFGSAGSNMFGSTAITQNQPSFGSTGSSGLFSTATTTQSNNNNAFGSSGAFSFGQNATQSPPNTNQTPQNNMFGSPNTNTSGNSPFVFGQLNNNSNNNNAATAAPNQSSGIFGAKPADNNPNTNSALTAPPSFGGSTPAFNFSAAKPTGFSFNAPNAQTANVPQFGSTNGMGTSFSFNASNNTPDSKPFAFGGPATAPAATPASFSFNSPSPAPNAFQFNAQQPAAPNLFSISGTSTTKTGRPMRTATRRIK